MGERAVRVLERLRAGECTHAEAVAPLADVLGNPSRLVAACVRAVNELGGQHEGAALVEALGMLALFAPAGAADTRDGGVR